MDSYRLIYNNNFNKKNNKYSILINDDKIKISINKLKLNYNYSEIDIWNVKKIKIYRNNDFKYEYEFTLNRVKLRNNYPDIFKFFKNALIKISKRYMSIEFNDILNFNSKLYRNTIIQNVITGLQILDILPADITINDFSLTEYHIAFNIFPRNLGRDFFYSILDFNDYIFKKPLSDIFFHRKQRAFLKYKKIDDKIVNRINRKYRYKNIKNPFRAKYFKNTNKYSIYFNGTKNSYFNFCFYDRAKNKNLLKGLSRKHYPYRFEIKMKGSYFKYPPVSVFFNGTAKTIFFNNYEKIKNKLNKIFSYYEKIKKYSDRTVSFFDFYNNPGSFIFLEDLTDSYIEKFCVKKNKFETLI